LSAHRAKGLEFDDVVVLDGAWEKRSDGEDHDAARRLFYVAMTRARRSLSLIKMSATHPILTATNDEAFLIRGRNQDRIDVSDCGKLYCTLAPSEVDLGYAGRLHDGNASLRAIARLSPGDPLTLVQRNERWFVTDADGVAVARLAKKYVPPRGARFLRGSVYAISTQFREDSAEEFRDHFRRERWNVVLPELVFERT
jgi:ATP-dependent DNA helicase RecQ